MIKINAFLWKCTLECSNGRDPDSRNSMVAGVFSESVNAPLRTSFSLKTSLIQGLSSMEKVRKCAISVEKKFPLWKRRCHLDHSANDSQQIVHCTSKNGFWRLFFEHNDIDKTIAVSTSARLSALENKDPSSKFKSVAKSLCLDKSFFAAPPIPGVTKEKNVSFRVRNSHWLRWNSASEHSVSKERKGI